MQSYLGNYHGAAKDRPAKLVRAVKSVLAQSLKDWELLVIADGCEETFQIISNEFSDHDNIDCHKIPKQPIWTGHARNYGITQAKGEWICYLDIDDAFGTDHLKIIAKNVGNYDWVYFNDWTIDSKLTHHERTTFIKAKFQNGTSNFAHKRTLNAIWGGGKYGYDDWSMSQSLLKFPNHGKIETPQYYVRHIPLRLES